MRTKEGRLSRKGLIVAAIGFMVLDAIVFALLYTAATHNEQAETYQLAEETATFLASSWEKSENTSLGYEAKAQQTLMDKARGFARFLPSDEVVVEDGLLMEFIRTEHMGGALVADASGQVVAKADLNEKDALDICESLLDKPAVQDILVHPNKSYTDMLERDGTDYNVVAVKYGDGLLLAYESLDMPTYDPYEYRVSDLLANNTFHKNPTVLMVQGGKVVSSNEKDGGQVSGHLDELLDDSVEWTDGRLTQVRLGTRTWYGIRSSYQDYNFYILYSSDKVFEQRGPFIAVGAAIYLSVSVVVLVVRGLGDRRNLEKAQKQLRIINAISSTYKTTFLLHLDTMTMEGVRMSEETAKVFAEHPEPRDFLEHACRDLVAPESREAVAEMMEADTIKERLHGASYLSVDIKSGTNIWYALQIIPQRWDKNGELIAVLVATRDVTAVKRAEELSFRDKLTGLRNRNYLESRGEELMRAGDRPVSVVMADCNYLKRTNDTMGHEWGDVLLQRVAGALRDAAGNDCLVMRIGGDEFLLVCPQTPEDAALAMAERARELLAEASDEKLTLSVSFGVACVGTDDGATTFDEAFKQADEAMYEEKRRIHAQMDAQGANPASLASGL